MLKDTIKTVSDFLKYMEYKYPENETGTISFFLKSEEISKFFISVIKN